MFQVQNVTANAKQKQTLILPDGTQIVFAIYYVSQQLGWFIRTISYKGFVANGIRITNSPNILHQFRNQIPFGLACFSDGDREPSLQTDFSAGFSKLYILDKSEVAFYNGVLTGES